MGVQIEVGHWGGESPSANEIVTGHKARAKTYAADSSSAATISSAPQPSSEGLWRLLYTDYRRYRATGARNALAVILLTQGFWASAVFRFSHWARAHCRLPGLRAIVNACCLLLQKFIEVISGISIPPGCNIGRGIYIGHFGGIFIDSQSRIGENCNLAQGVTIGKGGRGELQGVPIIGDRVHVGANALILGKITIGNNAVIGPGSVVMVSVPPCGVAMGNPARVVGLAGSFDIVKYDNMANDPARKLELEAQRSQATSGNAEEGPWNA